MHNSGNTNAESAEGDEPKAGAGGGADTPPSNTVSDNSNPPPPFQVLRFGVDSLYLSFPGSLAEDQDKTLAALKAAARSGVPGQEARAQLRLGTHIFEVKDKGSGRFAYVLEDAAYRISVASVGARALPMAYVKVSSYRLAATGPADIEGELQVLLAELGQMEGSSLVSRIDLFVDFVSGLDMESWTRRAWVTRASSVAAYAVKDEFTGWAIGLGGPMAGRLYDKTLELKKSLKDWLKPLWLRNGWDGESRVLRLEFEIKRETLKTFELDSLDSVLPRLGALWSYATHEWLRLAIPNADDSTRSRWPTHPVWQKLAGVDWEGDPAPLSRSFSVDRAPSIKWILRQMLAFLFSFMAVRGIYDFVEGVNAATRELDAFLGERAEREFVEPRRLVRDQVGLKARRFNTAFNDDKIPDEDRLRGEQDELMQRAQDYKDRSRGR